MKMNTSLKRVFSFLMALVMVLTLAPVPVHAAEAVTMTGGEVLYLKPNSNWVIDNPRFAAYFFGDTSTWADMEPVPGNEGYYQLTVPTGSWTNVIFCRMNPNDSANSWDTRWNQTGDLAYDGENNLFTVPEITGMAQPPAGASGNPRSKKPLRKSPAFPSTWTALPIPRVRPSLRLIAKSL